MTSGLPQVRGHCFSRKGALAVAGRGLLRAGESGSGEPPPLRLPIEAAVGTAGQQHL